MSASKFVFMSSVPGAAAGGAGADDSCARTGFEEPAAREANGGGDGGSGREGERGRSTSRPPFSASGANAGGSKSGAGAFSGIVKKRKGLGGGAGGVGGGGVDKGRLWKGLCASGKQNPRR